MSPFHHPGSSDCAIPLCTKPMRGHNQMKPLPPPCVSRRGRITHFPTQHRENVSHSGFRLQVILSEIPPLHVFLHYRNLIEGFPILAKRKALASRYFFFKSRCFCMLSIPYPFWEKSHTQDLNAASKRQRRHDSPECLFSVIPKILHHFHL
jgi:hypothetical protein